MARHYEQRTRAVRPYNRAAVRRDWRTIVAEETTN
jgi:hypothetical protein